MSFPRLRVIDLPAVDRPLQLLIRLVDATTPIETVELRSLDDETLQDLKHLVNAQPTQTLKRVIVGDEGYTTYLPYFNEEEDSDGEERMAAEEEQYDELHYIILPRLERFREWSAQHGIEVVATWADQALG